MAPLGETVTVLIEIKVTDNLMPNAMLNATYCWMMRMRHLMSRCNQMLLTLGEVVIPCHWSQHLADPPAQKLTILAGAAIWDWTSNPPNWVIERQFHLKIP